MSRHSQISRCAPIGLKNYKKLDDAAKLTKINIHLKCCKLIKKLFLFRIVYIRDSGSHCGL